MRDERTDGASTEPIVDAHVHLVDFLQRPGSIPALLRTMDEANVERAVVFGLPVAKEWAEWEPSYYLSDNARCYHYGLTDAIVADAIAEAEPSARVLEEHPNLHLDLSWLAFDELVCPEGEPREAWIDLAEHHPERVCVGSDAVGSFDDIGEQLSRFEPFLRALSAPTARALRVANAERLYAGLSADHPDRGRTPDTDGSASVDSPPT